MAELTWNQFVRIIFNAQKETGSLTRPWKVLGVHHMTWAAMEYTKLQQQLFGVGDPTVFRTVERETPESIYLEAETTMMEAA